MQIIPPGFRVVNIASIPKRLIGTERRRKTACSREYLTPTIIFIFYDSWSKPISTTGSLSATLGVNQPFRYRGYVYDTETGWYYLQSRYYDPSICRFVSADVYLSTG